MFPGQRSLDQTFNKVNVTFYIRWPARGVGRQGWDEEDELVV